MKKCKKIALIILAMALLVLSLIIIKNEIYATTTLPKVYFEVSDVEAFENMVKDGGDQLATIRYEDSAGVNFTSYMKIKVQGSSSAVYPKKNYTINLYKDSGYTEKQKVDMAQGWGNASKYCLKANWIDDTTHSRNVVTAKLVAKMQAKYGLFTDTPNNGAIDGFPVEIYLNGEFWGLYTWNIPKDEWMWNLDKDNPNHIAMVGDSCADSSYFKEEITSVATLADDGWEIEVGEETQATVDKFNRLIRFVKNSTDEEFKNNIDSYLDKDSMLNYLVVQYLTLGYDNTAKNMILVTYDGQLWYPTLYDLDSTWGTNHRGKLLADYEWLPDGESGYKEYAPHANDSVLLKKVIRCFPDELAERWFELRKDIFSKESILAEFEEFWGRIPEATLELEEEVWNERLTEYLAGLTESGRNSYINMMGKSTIPGHNFDQIRGFIDSRLPYVDEVMYNKFTTRAGINLTYSTENATKGNVIVTAQGNRGDITFGTNPTSYTFTENGTYTFTATDGIGNQVTAIATVDWIDNTAPTVTVNYSTTEITNQNIAVRITSSEEIQEVAGWNLSTDKKILTKIYSANGSETVTIYDLVGNEYIVNVNVNNIDKTAPNVTVNYSTTNPTNQEVTVTITSNEPIREVIGWNLSTDRKTLTITCGSNGSETVTIYDLAGNQVQQEVQVNNIDKVAPEIAVSYSTTELTNQDVIVTITSNEPIREVEGWNLSTDRKTLTKTYGDNGSETVTIYDLAGNQAQQTAQINVSNIHKTQAEITVSYSTTEITNQNVTVTIRSSEVIREVAGWSLSENKILTKTYTSNASETVIIYDLVGNEYVVNVNVNNIDKTAPTVTVNYNTTNPTNQEVTVTITSNEQIREVTGWNLSTDRKTLTKTYTSNGSETVTIYDLAGNQAQQETQVSVNNIDKTAPEISVSYNITAITNENVIVTITSNEQIREVEGWNLSTDRKTLTKTYTSNGSEAVTVYDLAGNQAQQVAQVNVNNIDKTAPTVTLNYNITNPTNQNVIVTITSNEPIREVTGWDLSADNKTLTKTYTANNTETVAIYDLAGNQVQQEVQVNNIDKMEPTVRINFRKVGENSENTLVTITSNEEVQEVADWVLSDDKLTLTKTYTQITQETIDIKDLVGNIKRVDIDLVNIDNTNPELILNYSETNMTNQNVIVTITSNEEIQEVEGWDLSDDKLTLTKTYTSNGSETVTVHDLIGNMSQIQVNVNNIDKTAPEVEVSYNITEMTNEDVIVTITSNEEIQEINGWDLSEDKLTLTKTYTTNSSQLVSIYDSVGNEVELQLNINNIDKTAPKVEVNSSKEEMTNEDVVITLIADEEIQEVEGWELSDDKLTLTKTFDENIQEKIEVKDLVGNVTEVDLNLINIDKANPVIKLDYSDEAPTNGDIVVIIKSEEEMQEIKGWELSEDKKMLTKSYEKNTQEIIEVKDLAGNITQIKINITNIDKIIPEINVKYSIVEKTDQDVTVTIIANEPIQDVNGWKLSTDKMTLTKTYEKNTEEVIIIKDLVGNIVEKNISISNIDKDKPSVEVKYSKTSDNYIVVKIISTEELQEVDGWELSLDKMTLTKMYKQDTQTTIEIQDLMGNATLVEIKVDMSTTEEETKEEKEESDKTAGNKTDNSTATGTIPKAGGTRFIIITVVTFSILLGIAIIKLNKYKGI